MQIFLNNPYFLGLGVLSVLDLILLVVLFWKFHTYKDKQRALFSAEGISNVEELVLRHKKLLSVHQKNLTELGKILEELVMQNKYNIQKIGIVRFNPFNDTGGNMSFAMALLDGFGNGIVISSLHSRDGTRIYAKSIEKGISQHRLTEEETQALAQAAGNQK